MINTDRFQLEIPEITRQLSDWATSHFPHLGKMRSSIRWEHPLVATTTPKIAQSIEGIKRDRWEYSLINTRLLEWVTIEIIKYILTRDPWNLYPISFRQSHIDDDVGRHVDGSFMARPDGKNILFGTDITFSKPEAARKFSAHATWSRELTVKWNQKIIAPHLILYIRGAMIYRIAEALEHGIKKGKIATIANLHENIVTIVEFLLTEHEPRGSLSWELWVPEDHMYLTPQHRSIYKEIGKRLDYPVVEG
jgi:hypothetical protein